MVTGTKGYSAGKVRKLRAARTAVAKAANILRARNGGNLRAPLQTYGWYGRYNRRGRAELKTLDVSHNLLAAGAGAVVLLNGCQQGNDYTNRDGRQIIMKSMLIRFSVAPYSTTTSLNQGDYIRLLVVYDKQTNGIAPTPGSILIGPDSMAPMNLNFRDRYKILMDKTVSMAAANYSAGALTNGSPTVKSVYCYRKLDLDTVFSGTGNTVADISTGAVFLLYISLSTASTTNIIGWTRIRFTDK